MDAGLLLHLCAPVTWRMALAARTVTPPSLLTEGFVHLSTPAQVTLPANALFAGRTDLLMLLIDSARLPGELRFELPYRDAPSGMRFPHHYGPVPASAVVAVIPYSPGPDGHFHDPVGLPSPDDHPARVRLFNRALASCRYAVASRCPTTPRSPPFCTTSAGCCASWVSRAPRGLCWSGPCASARLPAAPTTPRSPRPCTTSAGCCASWVSRLPPDPCWSGPCTSVRPPTDPTTPQSPPTWVTSPGRCASWVSRQLPEPCVSPRHPWREARSGLKMGLVVR